MKSPVQVELQPNGAHKASLLGLPVSNIEIVPDDGVVFDWLEALSIPKDWDRIAAMAVPHGMSPRRLQYIACDHSETTLQGKFKFQPERITFVPNGLPLTLGHLGYVIGACELLHRGDPREIAGTSAQVEGAFIVGEARLFNSDLAAAAWRGIQEGIFKFVSMIVIRPSQEAAGGGEIIEIGVTDSPGCHNAKILKAWE